MNELNVSLQHSILTLAEHGWSHRRIARELDINRETVGKYLALVRSKPAISTPGSMVGRQSLCQPWLPQIERALSVGLSAQRIYQDLVGEHGFSDSYQAVKRFVRHLRQIQPIPFARMEVEPGAEAQVDFGQGARVIAEGKRKRPHLFRIVLNHSRKGYSEAVWGQTTESFIRCLENAFRYFGGVPKTLGDPVLGECIFSGKVCPNMTSCTPTTTGAAGRLSALVDAGVPGPGRVLSTIDHRQRQEAMTIEITQHGSGRWAVFLDGWLLCVTVYKKGALAVRHALLHFCANAGPAQESASLPRLGIENPSVIT